MPLIKPKHGNAIMGMYQRRTQKGMGRTEKTVHNGAAKNPRLLKACNITRQCDMGEFFFISIVMKLFQIFYHAKKHNFPDLRGLNYEFYANFTLSVKISLITCLTSSKDRVFSLLTPYASSSIGRALSHSIL